MARVLVQPSDPVLAVPAVRRGLRALMLRIGKRRGALRIRLLVHRSHLDWCDRLAARFTLRGFRPVGCRRHVTMVSLPPVRGNTRVSIEDRPTPLAQSGPFPPETADDG